VGDKVIMIGRITGSHLQLPKLQEFGSRMIIWAAKVKKNLVVECRLIDDNEEIRRILGATLGQKSFSGFWLYLIATRQVTWWVGEFWRCR
jgi:hypothetical protein